MSESKCTICKKVFVDGDFLQAFLRSEECPEGSWTDPVKIGHDFQDKIRRNEDKVKRKHKDCSTLNNAQR